MAEADIAFAAAAGAAGLALAVSAWAWRLRQSVGRQQAIDDQERTETVAALAGSVGALAAFGDVRIHLRATGRPTVFGDEDDDCGAAGHVFGDRTQRRSWSGSG